MARSRHGTMLSNTKSSDLHVLLQATDADTRILRAIRCPNTGAGLIPALEWVEKSLSALAAKDNLPRAQHWLDACRALHVKCEKLERDHTYLSSLPKESRVPAYDRLAHPPSCQLFDDAADKSLALLGYLIAAAVSRNEELNVAAVDCWWTLHRGQANSSDWERFADAIPQTKLEIDAALRWVKLPGLRRLLEQFQVALATPLTEPSSAVQASSSAINNPASETSSTEYQSTESRDDGEDPSDRDANPQEKKRIYDELKKISPTGWLIKQALHARHTQLFGLIGPPVPI